MLQVQNLSKSYSPKGETAISGCGTTLIVKPNAEAETEPKAVNNLSFEVQKHEIVAVLGENGSGKSTLLKLLAGLLEADSGTILLNKKVVGGPSTKLVAGHEHIKLIHQNFNLFPNKTLAENIVYAMRFHTESYQQTILNEMLDMFQLVDMQHKYPREVSGGEQQRTAIATALSTRTDLLLFDEPFSNLDVFNGFKLLSYIQKLSRKYGMPILLVSHQPQDVFRLATRVLIIKEGAILQEGTPQQVYEHPSSAYVAGLTGTFNPINKNWVKSYFSLNTAFGYGIRFEHVHLTEAANADFMGTVKAVWYTGATYIYQVALQPTGMLHTYSTVATYKDGDTVYLKADKNAIFRLDRA